ncbi:hypothetical protein AKG30_09935 [Lacticaseibacillus paracasei]|nr:hypothetical protein AKG30_09935 [Lacticaseibacillus paracasei]
MIAIKFIIFWLLRGNCSKSSIKLTGKDEIRRNISFFRSVARFFEDILNMLSSIMASVMSSQSLPLFSIEITAENSGNQKLREIKLAENFFKLISFLSLFVQRSIVSSHYKILLFIVSGY